MNNEAARGLLPTLRPFGGPGTEVQRRFQALKYYDHNWPWL